MHSTPLQIWDLLTYKVRHTLVGHGGIVHAVVVVGKKLISGSSDKTIRVLHFHHLFLTDQT